MTYSREEIVKVLCRAGMDDIAAAALATLPGHAGRVPVSDDLMAVGSTIAPRLRRAFRSTSTRNFLIVPLAVMAEQSWSRRRLRPRWVVGAAGGYLLYLSAGQYRNQRGGGGPGIANPPLALVTTGPYRLTRNPMYLGHAVFLVSLTLATRSPWALAYTAYSLPWFDLRVRTDEKRLAPLFGDEYLRYLERVPRWLGLPGKGDRSEEGHTPRRPDP